MPVNDIDTPQRISADHLIPHIPGVIFQLHRARNGHMRFPYIEGGGVALKHIDRDLLAQNAGELVEQLTGNDHPKIMSAIERSARWMLPLTTRFLTTVPERKTTLDCGKRKAKDGRRWSAMERHNDGH